jgi:leukotriene-A4 hydrolase
MGNYEWGKYNVLILPNSFPFSGMENPCLSFCSPCLINGDKSLVDIIFHELIHSWSGNLVTNENWRDFWLNEGITMFLQRKIISKIKGNDYAKMDAILGLSYIQFYLDYFGENSTFTSLRPDLNGISPDDIYSDIPYEKGFNFVFYIESLIGEEKMEKFFKEYFLNFKYKSIDVFDFKRFFIDFCLNNSISEEIINKIDWESWIFKPENVRLIIIFLMFMKRK